MKYSVVSRRKGNRRAYSDGYVYGELKDAEREAIYKHLSGHYTMVKIVEYDSNKLVKKYTKSKQ